MDRLLDKYVSLSLKRIVFELTLLEFLFDLLPNDQYLRPEKLSMLAHSLLLILHRSDFLRPVSRRCVHSLGVLLLVLKVPCPDMSGMQSPYMVVRVDQQTLLQSSQVPTTMRVVRPELALDGLGLVLHGADCL